MSISASLDLSKTFFLNSLLGANQTIYLDFDSNITSGTFWNTSKGLANIITPAFDFDSDTHPLARLNLKEFSISGSVSLRISAHLMLMSQRRLQQILTI